MPRVGAAARTRKVSGAAKQLCRSASARLDAVPGPPVGAPDRIPGASCVQPAFSEKAGVRAPATHAGPGPDEPPGANWAPAYYCASYYYPVVAA